MTRTFLKYDAVSIFVAISATMVLLIGCHKKSQPDQLTLTYRYTEGDSSIMDSKVTVKADVRKLKLGSDTSFSFGIRKSETGKLGPASSPLFPEELLRMLGKHDTSHVEAWVTTETHNRVMRVEDDGTGKVISNSQIVDISILTKQLRVQLLNLQAALNPFLGRPDTNAIGADGRKATLHLLGTLDLSGIHQPLLTPALDYAMTWQSFPHETLSVGKGWDHDARIHIPFDSLTDGQSKGWIDASLTSRFVLEKTQSNLAYVSVKLHWILKWNVAVPKEGYTTLNLDIEGSGDRMFDLDQHSDYGSLIRGTFSLLLDAKTQSAWAADIGGTFEYASKVRTMR